MFHRQPASDLTHTTVPSVSTDPNIRGRLMPRWLHRVRSPAGAAGLGLLAVLALLLLFLDVMQGAVQRGESRRLAEATQAEARFRCSMARGIRSARPRPPIACP